MPLESLDLEKFLADHRSKADAEAAAPTNGTHGANGAAPARSPSRDRAADPRARYAEAALEEEVDAVVRCTADRNIQLNTSAFKLFTIVAAGQLDEQAVAGRLTNAARACGLDEREIGPTIASARRSGMSEPRDFSGVGTAAAAPDWAEIMGGRPGTHAAPAARMDAADLDTHTACPAGQEDNPHRLARLYVNGRRHPDGPTLRFWREDFHRWHGSAYRVVPIKEIRAELTEVIESEFRRLHNIDMLRYGMRTNGGEEGKPAGKPPVLRCVTTRLVGDVLQALQSVTLLRLSDCPAQPTWIGAAPEVAEGEPWDVTDVLPARNGLIHLPSIAAGRAAVLPPTPRFFTPYALDYDFADDAPRPTEWLRFLDRLWPTDPESIETLQEWMGYLLTGDTSQQKILMLVGPKRSGKGTIGRVLTSMIGPVNVGNPTLGSLAERFGLEPMIGKLAAIIGDAKLSHRMNVDTIIERLLSISGEDFQTIDRKNSSAVTTRLPTRFVILCNSPPKFKDASNAIVGRLILLRMTQTFFGREDPALYGRLLPEMPGILLWSIEGWRRLRARGRFVQPESSAETVANIGDISSPVATFIEDCCDLGSTYRVPVGDLYNAWKTWCQAHGRERTGDEHSFGRDLHAAVPELVTTRPRMGGTRLRVYQGVRVRVDNADQMRTGTDKFEFSDN